MNKKWMRYYRYIEKLRASGINNMFEISVYLEDEFNLYNDDAKKILVSWMKNYDDILIELKKEKEVQNGKRQH